MSEQRWQMELADGRPMRHRDDRTVHAQQQAAIAALISEQTVEDAAIKASIPERLLHEWLATPTFCAAYQTACEAAVAERLLWVRLKAVDTLVRNLTCGQPAVEVEAARIILQQPVSDQEAPRPAAHQRASWVDDWETS